MESCNAEQAIDELERRLAGLRGQDLPLETIGSFLDDARRLYVRQLDPQRMTPQGQEWGPFVEWSEVVEPFPEHLLYRLGKVIDAAERAFDGISSNEWDLIDHDMARIPTQEEVDQYPEPLTLQSRV